MDSRKITIVSHARGGIDGERASDLHRLGQFESQNVTYLACGVLEVRMASPVEGILNNLTF